MTRQLPLVISTRDTVPGTELQTGRRRTLTTRLNDGSLAFRTVLTFSVCTAPGGSSTTRPKTLRFRPRD